MERSTKDGRFRRSLAFVIAALIIQYLLGMAVNLFVKIPTDHPGANPPEYFGGVAASVGWAILHGGSWLTLHPAWGLLWVPPTLATLFHSIRLPGGRRPP